MTTTRVLAHESDLARDVENALEACIARLGHRGGDLSASVYDTSVALRAGLPGADRAVVAAWLVGEQQADGGWETGGLLVPRLQSSMAALLALHGVGASREEVAGAYEFLGRALVGLGDYTVDDLLNQVVGAELIMPKLADECAAAGLPLPEAPLRRLRALRQRKLLRLEAVSAGSAASHVFEALGDAAWAAELQDLTGGVGHSPAATAVWYRRAAESGVSPRRLEHAEVYFDRAARVTAEQIPGVLPTVWPTTLSEQVFGLHPMAVTGLALEPRWRTAVDTALLHGRTTFLSNTVGIGMSSAFEPDSDGTGVLMQLQPDLDIDPVVEYFANGEGLLTTYPTELNPSPAAISKCATALRQRGRPDSRLEAYLLGLQRQDGLWPRDKWNLSPLNSTMNAVIALAADEYRDAVERAVREICRLQRPDGSWGLATGGSVEESAYAALTLLVAREAFGGTLVSEPLERALAYLTAAFYSPTPAERVWVGKVPYSAPNWDRVFHLAVLARLLQAEDWATPRSASLPKKGRHVLAWAGQASKGRQPGAG